MSTKNSKLIEEITKRLQFIVDEKFHGVWTHLAKKAGIPSGTFARYMKGEGIPKLEQFVRIMEVTQAEPRWLLTGEGPIYRNDVNLWGGTWSTENRRAVYLEAGRIIAALQQRIEQLEAELDRVKSSESSLPAGNSNS